MNEITLFPVSGLGNRIAAIESAVKLAEENGFDRLIILWDQTTVPCPFDELISAHSDKCEIVVKTIYGGNRKNIISRVLHGVMVRMYTMGTDKSLPLLDGGDNGKVAPESFPKSGRVYIRACTEFYPFEKIVHVSFNDADQEKAKNCLPVGRRCIGVHIRRGDNYNASNESSTELFIDRIIVAINKDDKVAFFLATDDQDVQKKLLDEFPGYIYVQPDKTNERFSKVGQHEAAVDMIALSMTEYIIGSFYSSFTDMAAKLGGIRSEIVRKDKA